MFAHVVILKPFHCSYLYVRGNPKIKYFPKDENWKYLFYDWFGDLIEDGRVNLRVVVENEIYLPIEDEIENEVEMFKEFCESVKKIEEMNNGGEKNE